MEFGGGGSGTWIYVVKGEHNGTWPGLIRGGSCTEEHGVRGYIGLRNKGAWS